jgi:hypothetical protein
MAITKGQVKTAEAAKTDTDNLSPATKFDASGAIIEPEIVERVDLSHPAVDSSPRANSSVEMNQIDFNDPTISQEEAVAKNLKEEKPKGD